MSISVPTIDDVAVALASALDTNVLDDLRHEDTASAVEVHFSPIRVRALVSLAGLRTDCSTDGFYDATIGAQPTILYAEDTVPERARFTILHDLGHHLLATEAAHLVDDIDLIAGNRGVPAQVEEAVCHRFAGRVLVADDLLEDVIGHDRLAPAHVIEVHDRAQASWEACAIRATGACHYKAAVVLIREVGVISFCAASLRLGPGWWPRGSSVDPQGPLAKATTSNQRARPETYRYALGFPEAMFCDSVTVHDGLTVAVLSDKPSDGRFEIVEEAEPSWKTREDFCTRCNEIRDTGWCEACSGRFCPSCERCRCSASTRSPVCRGCGLESPRRDGAEYCHTCEADGVG